MMMEELMEDSVDPHLLFGKVILRGEVVVALAIQIASIVVNQVTWPENAQRKISLEEEALVKIEVMVILGEVVDSEAAMMMVPLA